MADEKRDEYGLSVADIQKIQEYRRTHDFTGNMSLNGSVTATYQQQPTSIPI